MMAQLGVSIHSDEIRALLIQRGRIRWHASLTCDFAISRGEAIGALLASAPKRLIGPRATIALGPAWCQVKQLEGLPAVKDQSVLSRLLCENSASFFLSSGRRLALSDVTRLGDSDGHWAAAFDLDLAVCALESLKAQGFAAARVVPSIVAVASLLPAGVHRWKDGDHLIELTTGAKGTLRSVRRIRDDRDVELPTLSEPLSSLGSEAWVNAAAFGAAMLPRTLPFAWRPAPDPKRVSRRMRIRLALAAALSSAAVVAAFAAPGARAAWILRSVSVEMSRLRASQTDVARMQGELRRVGATLERVERFREQRGRTTMLLGAISQALPESTALVTLRLDSLDGNFVALTPHAADILPQLVSVSGLSSPRIVGSLTKETVAGAQLERATVRFKRDARTSRITTVSAPTAERGRD